MEYKHILFSVRDHTAYIVLNNPEKRNPIGNDVKKELMDAFDACDFDPEIRCVVIRGAGGCFSAGGDMNAMKKRIDNGELGTKISCRLGAAMNQRLRAIPKPTIALLEGAATGSGLSLALSCDFQIVEEKTKMAFSFVNIGYVPDSGALYLVTRALGTVKATELLMSGRRFLGREAADMGLVTVAVPREELESTLESYVAKYANGPTVAYGYIKAMMNRSPFTDYTVAVESEIEYQGICEQTQDHKEAVCAFLEKRKPVFQGK